MRVVIFFFFLHFLLEKWKAYIYHCFWIKKNEILENRKYFLYKNMGKPSVRYYLTVDFSVNL